ncbi:MAG: prepilin-type N-terminal cleavage/methylation domain-containing protein [Candidatus Peribacteria bacterium]|nr:MAG: prepilin-type N-terminal cleavage/methylation domain-containing protein [Candidatus Peribacteria bacterium]
MQHKKYAFTLVELIVVITILAILGTLSFVYFQSYTQNARDGVRVSDMGTIKKSLGIYVIQRGSYPEPSDGVDITYSGATIWTQGTFGESMFRNLSTVNKVPTDPLSSSNYTYSVLGDRQEYQLAGVLESPVLSQTLPLPQAAASTDLVQSYIIGNYNGMVTKVSTGGTDYVLAVPSLISTDLGYTDIIEVIGNKLLTYDGYAKVAASFSGRYQSSQEYNFTPSRVLVYSGDITSLIDGQEQITLLKNIQEAYSGTIVAQDDVQIKNITNLEVSQQDPSSKAKVLACNIINFQLKYYVDCNDIDFIVFYIVNVLHIDISNIPGNTIQAVFQSTDDALRF